MLKVTFDGDKVAVTIILTKEANDEALAFLKDPQAFFSLDGKNQRKVLNKDSISGIYGLTIDSKDAPALNDKVLTKEIVDGTSESLDVLLKYTLDDYDEETKKIKPSPYKIESPCTYPINGVPTKTTLGRAVFYHVICEPIGLPFMNQTLTKKEQNKILGMADAMVLEKLKDGDKEFFTETYIPWLNKWEEFNFVVADVFSPSIDMNVYATSEEYDTYRDELISENKERIENGDIMAYDDIESKIISKLKETHKKEGVDTRIFDSGSKLSYNDDLRNGLVAVGPMPIGVGAGKFKISTSGLLYGTKKDERATYSQSNIVAGYFRAMGPATGGTIAKEILGASHNIKFGPKGSDCGRKVGQVYEIDDYFVEHLHLRYMIRKDGTLEQLTRQSLTDKYYGQRITVRASHFCGVKGDPCNICAGDQPYVVAGSADTVNVGAQKSRTGDEITQTSLSKFHESKTTFAYVDFNDYIVFSDMNIKEGFEGLLDEMNSYAMTILEEGDEVSNLDDALDAMDDALDSIVELVPEEFLDFLDEEHLEEVRMVGDFATESDIDELGTALSMNTQSLDDLKKIFDPTRITIVKTDSFVSWFGNDLQDTRDILTRALINNRLDYIPLYMYSVSDEQEWYKLGFTLAAIKDEYTGDDYVTNKCATVMEEAKKHIGALCDINVTKVDDIIYLTADYKKIIPWYLIPDYELFVKKDETIEESASGSAKGREEIIHLERKMRSKTEMQEKQLLMMYTNQKKKAKQNISDSMNDKATKLEHQMKVDKEAYRKHLQEQLAQFEINYEKANKFKLFKLKNKLNFVYSKKSTAIDTAMNEAIRHLHKKNRAKLNENKAELKAKYGV